MIKLNEKYFIETDACNYILQEKKVYEKGKKTGQEYFVNIGYYGKLEWLYTSIIEEEIRANIEILTNIEQLIEFKKEIIDLVKKANK